MIRKILIANRGEIAVRVMRACREMGIASVAVYSKADAGALFTLCADQARLLGPAPAAQSYLDMGRIIRIAKETGADAIHPGYGFLAENPDFAAACESEGLRFIGPGSRVLRLLGDKLAARREMTKAGVPVVPGTKERVEDLGQARRAAEAIGYPVILKPSGGGGGIGMTIVAEESGLAKALESSRAIAEANFALGDIYIEKYLANPRHIEFQILGDSMGNTVHLGERECSIQRRHQKLIEESPSAALTPKLRETMGQTAVKAAKWVGYEGAGTVEFLFAGGRFYFLEVNARVQVEHPVTEMVTGIDIVKEQIRIAAGLPLSFRQEDVTMRGSAIECRINAEDPLNGFAPSPGRIQEYHAPGGPGIRVDSGICSLHCVPPYYDPLLSKLIAWGADRDEAIARMRRALFEYVIGGVKSNLPFHQAVMENPRFLKGDLGTHFMEQETNLLEEMKRMGNRGAGLREALVRSGGERKKVAAIAAVTTMIRMHEG